MPQTGTTSRSFEERTAALEDAFLSPLAQRSYPAIRAQPEPDSPVRTPFQRDRDRIVHCKAFRRLKHKTQVYIAPEGDHYRTRLTHTLETSGIARTVARALGLNEDLTEAIGMGHDLGHAPFGHIGEDGARLVPERALWDALPPQRAVAAHRRAAGARRGRAEPHRAGARRHPASHPRRAPATLEGRIVRLVDRIAYINHDIDDALRAGTLHPGELPTAEIEVLGETGSLRIDTLVRDLVERSSEAGDIVQSDEVGGAMDRLRTFMFERVYLGPGAQSEQPRIERMLQSPVRPPGREPPRGGHGRRERGGARGRLRFGDDGPVCDQDVCRSVAAAGLLMQFAVCSLQNGSSAANCQLPTAK